jgi:hypothetical protein
MPWLTDFVFPFPDLVATTDLGPPSCKEIRQRIAGLQLQVQLLQQQLQTASPGQKPAIIDMIQALHAQIAALEPALETCVEEPVRNLTIAGIEHTQAIQFFRSQLSPCPDRGLSGACPDNGIAMVAGKPVILRVYVDVAQVAGQPTIQNITGVLETTQAGSQFPDIPITPYNGPITGRRESDIDRSDAGQTLNFRIPASRCRGRLLGRVTVFDPARPGEVGFTSAPVNLRIDFVETKPVKLRLVRIRYDDPSGLNDAPAPTTADFWSTIEYVLKTYPIPRVDLVANSVDLYDGNFTSFFASGGPAAQGTTGTIFQILDRYRAAENLPGDVVYMALIPGPPANKTGAAGWAISQRVVSQVMGSVAAQELGHLCLGNPHAPCGVANPDPNYPLYDGYPGASIGEFGFDYVTSAVPDPATTFDFMSYCGPTWVSPYTYERLLRCYRLAAAARPAGPFADAVRDYLDLRLSVTRDGRATVHEPVLVRSGRVTHGTGERTPYLVELHGSSGVLETMRILRTDPNRTDDDAVEELAVSVPAHPEATRIVVTREREPLGSYDLSAHTPAVELRVRPHGSSVTLDWNASGRDPGAVVLLRYSADDGRTWRLLGRGGAEGTLEIPRADLPKSTGGLFEAVAQVRGRSASARSEEVPVEGTPARALILSPHDGGVFRHRDEVYLYGAAESPDGSAASDTLQWRSDLDGPLGQGAQVVVHTLSPGRHCLTLEADDGCGKVATASLHITVGPPGPRSPLGRRLAGSEGDGS